MKTTLVKFIVPAVLFGSILLPLAANASSHVNNVNWRLHHQQKRINTGSKDHQLTRHEQYALDARDNRIRGIEDLDREHHDGHLTTVEHRHLEHDLNRTSHVIHRERRNGN